MLPLDKAGTFDTLIKIDCVADQETRQQHIDAAIKLGLPQVIKRKERKGKVAIVGSGPSVTDYVDMLKEFDGEIWGINRSFEWMRHRGVKPTAFLGIDPEWFLKDCLLTTPDDVTYYLASQVHPSIFDYLKGKNIRLWHMADSEVTYPKETPTPIYGGSTCLSRAPNLAWQLGYRECHVFGGDSSFTHKTHVHGGKLPPNAIVAEVGGQVFKTTKTMMSQGVEFVEQMVEWARQKDPLAVSIYGEGLMQSMVAQAMEAGGYETYIMEEAPKGNRAQRRAARV